MKIKRLTDVKSIVFPYQKRKLLAVIFVLTLIPICYFFVYISGGAKYVYAHAMYIPIVIAGVALGLKWGVFSALLGGVLLGPFMPLDTVTNERQYLLNWLFRLLMFVIIAILSGKASDLLKKKTEVIKDLYSKNQFTQIPNINYLSEITNNYEQTTYSAMTILINNYENIIDLLGMDVFFEVLKQVYKNLIEGLEKDSIIIQSERNRFWVCKKQTTLELDIAKIKKVLNKPSYINNVSLYVEYSIGGSSINDCNLIVHPEAYRASDLAARYAQKNNLASAIYNDKLLAKRGDFELITLFSKALKDGETELVYQPKIDLKTNKPIGLEALIRWYHPIKGLIMPDYFIPLIEETQLINVLTEWVLDTAIVKCQEFKKENIDVHISINISAKNLFDKTFYDTVMSKIAESKINSTAIELEVTESVLINNIEESKLLLRKFLESNVAVSIDDFGKGYSSLSYLHELPIKIIKLDKHFIREFNKDSKVKEIVASIIRLSHSLGYKVVAEGIEDYESVEMLKELDCDYGQGYYFAKPMKSSDVIEWYRNALKEKIHV
jgi:EAL domain-containing protein (putative c-di-GMP-specific phosphodiesterase class I)/GGDEF domain-containing protein